MNRFKYCVTGALLLMLFTAHAWAEPQLSGTTCELRGKIRFTEGTEGIQGITINLVERGISTEPDAEGTFIFHGLPAGRYTLTLEAPYCLPQSRKVSCPQTEELLLFVIALPLVKEAVTVTATPWNAMNRDQASMVQAVSSEQIKTLPGASLGETVSGLLGVRAVSTGDSASVPLIRGQTNEHIRVLKNGIYHDYFQFSRRHMPNLEPYDAEKVEVVSGPASVLYGSQAGSGVVNLVSAIPVYRGGKTWDFSGETLLGYADANRSGVFHTRLKALRGGFFSLVSLTRRSAGDIRTPGEDLSNTGYNQFSSSMQTGICTPGGLLVSFSYDYWRNGLGFYIPVQPRFHLDLHHESGTLTVNIPSTLGKWELSANKARNVRRAYPMGLSQGAKVDLELDSALLRLSLNHKPLALFDRGVLRFESSHLDNETSGPTALLPNYQNRTWSTMIFEEIRLLENEGEDRLILHAGLRFDQRHLESEPLFTRTYHAWTGGLGMIWHLDSFISTGFSINRGWRNPSEFELFANGSHDGVQLYARGNPDLSEETNSNAEFTVRLENKQVSASLALFANTFDNYIFLRLTGAEVQGLPDSTFSQADATIKGIEGRFSLFLNRFLTLAFQGEMLRTRNKSTGTRLPFTPPHKASVAVVWHDFLTQRFLQNPSLTLHASWTGKGTIAGADEPFPLNTEGYVLVDVGAGLKFLAGDSTLHLDLWVGNILNHRYRDFLNTYKALSYQTADSKEFDHPFRRIRPLIVACVKGACRCGVKWSL